MKFKTIAVALCAMAMFVAGCGDDENTSSSGSSGSSTSSGSGAASPKAPEGDPIKLGFICSCSGGQAQGLGRSKDVIQAWADTVNAAGGLNGHPVKLFIEDDGADPAKGQRAAKKLVEEDGVMAIVGTTSAVAESWAKYVSGKGVPAVGGNSFLAPFVADANFYPTGASLPVMLFGMSKAAKDAGKGNLGAVYCAETPICAQLGGLAEAIGGTQGLKVATGKAGVAQPNFTALCLSLKDKGVDALAVAQSAPTVTRVHGDCAKQGFDPLPMNFTSGSSPSWYKDANFDGKMLLIGGQSNYQDESNPEAKRFLDAMDKYVPDLRESEQFGYSGSWDPWLGGVLFEKAAAAGKLEPTSTSADVKAALATLKDEDLNGATSPLTFTKDKPTLVACYFRQKIEGGGLVSENNNEPICLAEKDLGALGKILGG